MSDTDNTRERVAGIAQSHGFAAETAEGMLQALRRGNGRQAQFDLPEAGGMGQWSSGGMLMIGDMMNSGLKARVQALIADLLPMAPASSIEGAPAGDWPAELGRPASSGAQGDMRYAVFPGTRRLAIRQGDRLRVYDTGDHSIAGVSQQQGDRSGLTFSGRNGTVALDSLTLVQGEGEPDSQNGGTIPDKIEQLHGLFTRGVLTREEYEAKKAELLSRM